MTSNAWAAIMLLAGGVFTGSAVFVAYERVAIWASMDLATYTIDFRRSIKRADPTQPILVTITLASGIGFAVQTSGTSRTLAFCGVACLLIILVGSIAFGEPINTKFRRRPEGVAPPEVERLRDTWGRLHRVRATLALAAFALLVVAACSN